MTYDGQSQSQTDLTEIDGSAIVSTNHYLKLTSGSSADLLTGGARQDSPVSRDGDDVMSEGGDDDTIVGGLGRGTLSGGTGNDVVSFGFGIPRPECSPNIRDTITDFEDLGAAASRRGPD